MLIDSETARAYTEVYVFLQCMDKEYTDIIPKNLLDYFDKNRDKSYNYRINPNASGREQFKDMSEKGLALIAYLNLEYWATDEERERLMKIYDRNEQKYKLQQYEVLLKENEDS